MPKQYEFAVVSMFFGKGEPPKGLDRVLADFFDDEDSARELAESLKDEWEEMGYKVMTVKRDPNRPWGYILESFGLDKEAAHADAK